MLTSWFGCVAVVAYFAMSWSYRPGEGRSKKPEPINGNGLRAVMLVHPDCPCTEASLNVYRNAVLSSGRPIETLIVIPGSRRTSRNIALAHNIPNAKVEFSSPEAIQRKFGISTSGHLLVWSGKKLVFSGGVTDARGEDVQAAAYRELVAALESRAARETPVFGCVAFGREAAR